MTQLIDLGKLRFHFTGEWNSATTYEMNDVVKYGGNVYVYTYALSTSNKLPTNTDYWALMVEGIKFKGAYANATAYKVGDGVAHGGKVYIAIADTTGNTPPNVAYWSQFADGIQYEGTYSNVAQYQRNDVVQYGASAYIAKQDTSGNNPTNTTFWDKLVEGVAATGVWSSVTAYAPGDLVAYGANLYKAVANNTNQAPANSSGVVNSNFWQVFNEGIRSRGTWATATEYYVNDVVSHGGNTYICLVKNASTTFNADLAANKWAKFNSGIRWRGDWTTGVSYLKDDVVRNAVGTTFLATTDHTAAADFATDETAGKWELFLAGPADVLPEILSGDNGRSLTVLPDGSGIDWIGATASDKVFYVAPHGVDSATSGRNLSSPFASIKYACQQAPAGSTIFVKTGTYSEQLPITVPANTAIVGDNQRTTIIQPAAGLSDDGVTPNNQATMFLMSNGSILNKMTFIGMTGWVPGTTADNIETSTIKGVVARLNPASPVTHKSPYVLECSAIGNGLIGALVDGTVHATGAKSMIFHGYTVISDNGIGYWVKDGARAEIVSCFTYYCYFGYATTGGGHIRALNGNNSYGTYGTVSQGFAAAETPVTGALLGQQLNMVYTGGNINVGDTITTNTGATGIVTNVQYTADKIYLRNTTGTFTLGDTFTATSGGTGTVSAGGLENQKGFVLVMNNLTAMPRPGQSIQIAGDTISYVVQSTTGTYTNTSSIITVVLSQEKPTGSPSGAVVTLRSGYSQIRLTGHDFLSIGTGGVTTTNYPDTPTQPAAQGNETVENFPGRVFYVSTDQDGNFRVGEYFRIDQATGRATLNASAFDLAGLTSLRLGSIGAQLGETINEFSSDPTLSGNSNTAVPTEFAVKSYVDGTLSNIDLNSIVGPSSILSQTGIAFSQQYSVFTNTLIAPYTWSLTGTVPSGVSINSSTGLLSGTTAVASGSYSFTIRVTGASGNAITKAISLVEDGAVPNFSSTTLPPQVPTSTAFTSTATQATALTGTVTHSITSGSIPSWATLSSAGVLSGTSPSGPNQFFNFSFTVTATNGSFSVSRSFAWDYYLGLIQGQTAYTTSGTYSWVAPAGVTSVSVVAVGGGGAGQDGWSNPAGAGAGLGWKNNIPVVPGQSYTVTVGAGGISTSGATSGLRGGDSFFINRNTVCGYGGGNATVGGTGGPNQNGNGGGWFGDGGGAGGNADSWQGGGGAGGYTARGGNAREYNPGRGGGGGNGGGSYSSTYGTGAGGGVGLNGEGTTGINFFTPWSGYSSSSSNGGGGQGGSGGSDGMYGENPWSSVAQSSSNIQGGTYGGGGGGPGSSWPSASGEGGSGGLRIIWGQNRAFPATNTADVTPSGPA